MKTKTIIVPLDFSNEALAGLNLSFMLADKTGANIQMVHVIEKKDSDEELEKKYQLAKIKFEDLLIKFREKIKINWNLSYKIKEGKIFKEVTDLAANDDDALIVLSTHGKSGFEELFIGGNTYKIASHSKNPVISIRGSQIPSNFNKIVLPLDITFQTREKVPYTIRLAKLFNSEIHLVTVRLSDYENVEKKLHQYANQVAAYIDRHGIPYKVEHLIGDNLTDITLDYSLSVNADLISIMTEQEKSVTNLLLGSYAHQMINKANIPVLSFPTYQLTYVTEDFRTEGINY
jgi:nucleotide-binding universal stress UspA family protein